MNKTSVPANESVAWADYLGACSETLAAKAIADDLWKKLEEANKLWAEFCCSSVKTNENKVDTDEVRIWAMEDEQIKFYKKLFALDKWVDAHKRFCMAERAEYKMNLLFVKAEAHALAAHDIGWKEFLDAKTHLAAR